MYPKLGRVWNYCILSYEVHETKADPRAAYCWARFKRRECWRIEELLIGFHLKINPRAFSKIQYYISSLGLAIFSTFFLIPDFVPYLCLGFQIKKCLVPHPLLRRFIIKHFFLWWAFWRIIYTFCMQMTSLSFIFLETHRV